MAADFILGSGPLQSQTGSLSAPINTFQRSSGASAKPRLAVFAFIEGFYDPIRRHASLGYRSPIDDEAGAMAENN